MATTRQPILFRAEFYPGDPNWLKGEPYLIEILDPHNEVLWRFGFYSRRYAQVILADAARFQRVPQAAVNEAVRVLDEWLPDDSAPCVTVNCQGSASTVELPQESGGSQEDCRRPLVETDGAPTFTPTAWAILLSLLAWGVVFGGGFLLWEAWGRWR